MSERTGAIDLPDADPGYYFDPKVVAGQHGEIRLSPNVESECRCGGNPPYQFFESAESEPSWCLCRSYRQRVRRINQLIAQSGLPERFRFRFLQDFLESTNGTSVDGATNLKSLLRSVMDSWGLSQSGSRGAPQAKGFLLWGDPGNGKTLLSSIALNELIVRFVLPGRFIGLSRKFFQTLRHTYDTDSPIHGQAYPILETLGSVPFLVIDDLGVQRDTEWEVEMLYNLIDTRYADRRLTVVTTNKPLDKLKDLATGRIYSRFLEMCHIVHVRAPDFREYGQSNYEF